MKAEDGSHQSFGDAFWRFSLRFYARDGVAEHCLRLQDEEGWDVNLVLFGLWTGLRHGDLEAEIAAEAVALSKFWRETAVAPLRRIRRSLKGGLSAPGAERLKAEAFRAEIKRIELLAEERQQRALAPLARAARPDAGRGAALQNLSHFARLDRLATIPDEKSIDKSEGVLAAAWAFLMREAQQTTGEDALEP